MMRLEQQLHRIYKRLLKNTPTQEYFLIQEICFFIISTVSCIKINSMKRSYFWLGAFSAFGFFLLLVIPVQAGELETVVETFFDAPTIVKGYTLESHDQKMRLGIRPNTLNVSTRVDIKTLNRQLMESTLNAFSEDSCELNLGTKRKLLGDIYLFDILNKSSYDGTDYFFLEIKYPEEDSDLIMHGRRRIYFFNAVDGMWHELPSEDSPENSSVRALIHLPYARLAIFEDTLPEVGKASWYAYKHCLCAASPDYPKGTKLRVTRVNDPESSVIVTVNDYGPDRSIHPERVIDLDLVAFEKLVPRSWGVVDVKVEVVE